MEGAVIPAWERRLVGLVIRSLFMRGRRGGPWPAPAELKAESVRFTGNTGADVAGHWFPTSSDRPRGVVVLVHPDRRYGRHWFVREGWVEFLTENGFDVLTFDLPGYGESRGGSTYYLEDVIAAVRYAQHHGGALPVHLVGLSLGAFSAINAAPSIDGLASLVLESPYPSFNAWYGSGWGKRAMDAWDRVFPRTSRLIQADENAARVGTERILVAATSDDAVTPVRLTRQIVDALPADRTRYVELEGVEHLALFRESAAYRSAILETLTGEEAVVSRREETPVVAGGS